MTGRRLVPAAARRTRLLLAALTWTAVGVGLATAGFLWLSAGGPAWLSAGAAGAAAVGWVKGRFVLAPRALANARRIEASAERAPVLDFFAPRAWALVVVMMAAGALLRRSAIPRPWLGLLYAAVGVALVLASVPAWRAYHERRRPER